ncbi:hypothetical protein ACJMK2_020102 [Sinanodonta woodiana]|uniref:Uncharacterized protein n=1 Tax=Sinanodonta woodiana TaxID=1069815 RepID=A0ABD3TYY3_SINWO
MSASKSQAQQKDLTAVVGPFYMNLAMMLEQDGTPYIVTDHKGFNWSDVSRVNDHVPWKTVVEVRPPMKELNRAVVDVFLFKKWKSTIMIMPENPKDNEECQDLANRLTRNGISPIAYSLRFDNSVNIRNQTSDVLRYIQLLEQKVILVCSPRDHDYNLIETVLLEAKAFGMLSDKSYTFFILDTSCYLKPLDEMNMYRKGFSTAACDILAFRYRDKVGHTDDDPKITSTPYALGAVDAGKILKEAQYHYLTQQKTKTDEFVKSRFLTALKTVVIKDGMTGWIKFNETGARTNYTLHLYKHGGDDIYTKIATWRPYMKSVNERLAMVKENKTIKQEVKGIFSDVEKVVVVLEEPFVMLRQNVYGEKLQGNEMYEGFTIDLLDMLAKRLQFKYEIIISPGNAYGVKVNGAWTGIVGQILAGNATLGMGAISITSQREQDIDFSLGIISTGVNILFSEPKEKFNMFQFLQPFSLDLWMAIIGASIAVSVIFYILDFRTASRQFTIKSTLWFSMGTLLMKGSEFSPRPISQRILTTGFLFFVLITVSTYTANMAAFLTMKNLEAPIESFEDLAEKDNYKILTVANSATMKFFETETKPVFAKIWERIRERNGLVANSTEGRKLVEKGGHAFLFDYLINSYIEMKYCNTKAVLSPILLQEHGIAMAAGAPFKTILNIELLRLKESGEIMQLRKRWWDNAKECDLDLSSRSSGQVEFDLVHTAGVFIVGAAGLGCSLAFFLFKKFYLVAKENEEQRRKESKLEEKGGLDRKTEKSSSPLFGIHEGKQSTV